jgi:hypothetical protein
MKLTPTQAGFLDHRLSAETVADVIASTHASEAADKAGEYGTPAWVAEFERVEKEKLPVYEAANAAVAKMVHSKELPLESMTLAEMEVLIDCIEGSTYFANEEDAIASGEITKSKSWHTHTAVDYLVQAIETVTGERINRDAI